MRPYSRAQYQRVWRGAFAAFVLVATVACVCDEAASGETIGQGRPGSAVALATPTPAPTAKLVLNAAGSAPEPTPTDTPLPCTLTFFGRVTDSTSGAAIDGVSLCLNSGFCAQTGNNGVYGGLCYPGGSSAGTYLCAAAAGYKQACQGPWPPTGGTLEVNFALEPVATPTLTPTSTPTMGPGPHIGVEPSTLSLGCEGSFDIMITNTGATGETLEISALGLANGYSQGYYGTGFSWDLSHITLPASLPSSATLTIPVTFSAAGQAYPSRLELTCESNATNSPHLFFVYFGGSQAACGTPTPTPTTTPTPTSNRPTPIARATVYPNPAYSGDTVTLDGSASSQPFESAQWSDDQGHDLTPGLVATFVAPNVSAETTLVFHLILRNYGGSSSNSISVSVTVLPPTCTGDCDDSHVATVDEVIVMVNIALGSTELSACPRGDRNGDGQVTVDELVTAVRYVLDGCPDAGPTFGVSGHVAEFPGCMGHMRGVSVRLDPLGLTTQTQIGPDPSVAGTFAFQDVPPGDYTLTISPQCNPYGCWPPTTVHVVDQDASVQICNLAS